ncbi:MAG: 50S ribosomal protein L25 [Alkalispirochaeta sp.]
MEQKVLTGETRTTSGKGNARALRRAGRIPAVVYGHSEPVSLSIEAREFFKEFHGASESQLITLKLEKEDRVVLIKDYSEDITTGNIMHIDFYEIEQGKLLRTRIAIRLTGTPVGVREGGVLDHSLYEVDIECLPKDIPAQLTIDVSGLAQGDTVHVGDISVPSGVTILNSPDQTVASVVVPRAIVEEEEEEDEAAADEVPVVGEEEEEAEEE